MKRLPVIAHLSPDEVGSRYRHCPDPKEKTRWHLLWLLCRPRQPLSCEQAAPLVGLSDVYARAVLKRWNSHGPEGLADRRRHHKSPGKLTPPQQDQVYDALQQEPPDGGLWNGPKLARFVRDRFGVEVCPETGWRWLKKLGFRLVVPRPRHPQGRDARAAAEVALTAWSPFSPTCVSKSRCGRWSCGVRTRRGWGCSRWPAVFGP